MVNWICNKKINIFENKNDSTYLFIKVENITQKDFILFDFNSRHISKHSDRLLNGAPIAYLSTIFIWKVSDSLMLIPVSIKFTPVFHPGEKRKKKKFDSDSLWVKIDNYYINLTYFYVKLFLIISYHLNYLKGF